LEASLIQQASSQGAIIATIRWPHKMQNAKYKTEQKTGVVFCFLSGRNKTENLKWNRNSIELTHPSYSIM
jgi:hypothetical protein